MVSCHQCSTPNSLDSAFCKRCGAILPEEDLREAQEKVAGWIKEGNTAFGDGKIDEALAIATTALESNPNYIDALVLKGLCHERQGNIPEALACAERIVELNPDSELDKIRRNGLRVQLGSSLAVPDRTDRRAGLLLAASAALLIFSVSGAAIYISNQKAPATRTVLQPSTPGQSFQVASQTPTQTQTTAPQQNPSQPTYSQRQTPTYQSSADQVDDSGSGGDKQLPIGPITVVPPTTNPTTNSTPPVTKPEPTTSDPGGDPPPGPDGGTTPTTPSKPDTLPPDPNEGISITVHHGNQPSIGGSQPIGTPTVLTSNGVEALTHTGIQQLLTGDYNAAAGSLEKALKGGGDPIKLNQRLGEAYSALGRTSDAIAAYSSAVAACQRAIQSGRGDRAKIEVVMKNCQDAGKVLGG